MNIFRTLYEQILFEALWDSDAVNTGDSPFLGNVYRVYELEYKLQALKRSQLGISNPKRLENITRQVQLELGSAGMALKQILLNTFALWLQQHALTKPQIWAEGRYNTFTESGDDDPNTMMEGIVGEYSRYATGGKVDRYGVRAMLSVDQFFPIIDKNLKNLPYTKSVLDSVYKIYMQEEYDNDPEGTMERWGISTPEEADQHIETSTLDQDGLEGMVYDMESLMGIIEQHGELSKFFIELYAKLVFPVWFAHWKAQGIVETRKRVQNVYNNLKKASPKDLGNLVAWLSAALNTAHQSGSMLDFVPEDDNFSVNIDGAEDTYYAKDLLDAVTDGKFNDQWDKELAEAGV